MSQLVLLHLDDVDRCPERAGTWPFDGQGKSYGCALLSLAGAPTFLSETEFLDGLDLLEVLERVYAPTEEGALDEARALAATRGWEVATLPEILPEV